MRRDFFLRYTRPQCRTVNMEKEPWDLLLFCIVGVGGGEGGRKLAPRKPPPNNGFIPQPIELRTNCNEASSAGDLQCLFLNLSAREEDFHHLLKRRFVL